MCSRFSSPLITGETASLHSSSAGSLWTQPLLPIQAKLLPCLGTENLYARVHPSPTFVFSVEANNDPLQHYANVRRRLDPPVPNDYLRAAVNLFRCSTVRSDLVARYTEARKPASIDEFATAVRKSNANWGRNRLHETPHSISPYTILTRICTERPDCRAGD